MHTGPRLAFPQSSSESGQASPPKAAVPGSVSARQTLVSWCEQLGAYAPPSSHRGAVSLVPVVSPHQSKEGSGFQAGMCTP